VRSGFWVGLAQLSGNTLQLVRSIVLARLLVPEVFGLMAACLTVTRGIELFSETGVRPALIHRRERFEDARDTGFCIMIGRGVVLTIVACGIAPLAAWYYGQPRLTSLICVLALSLGISGFTNINTVRLEKDLDFRRLAMAEQLGVFGSFVIVVGLAYWFRSVWALVVGQVLGAGFNVLASYVVVPGRPRLRFNSTVARELMGYGRFITGLTIVLFLTTELDNIVVGKVLGMEQLGYYLIAYTLANLPATHISKVISRVLFPVYSVLRDDRSRLTAAYVGVLQVVASFCLAAAAGMIVLAHDIISVAYGTKWLGSVQPLRILALFGGIRAIGAINGYLYNGIGKPNIPFYTNLGKLAVILAFIVPATKAYGLVGVSLAVTIPMIVFYFVEIAVLDWTGAVPWRATLSAMRSPVLTTVGMSIVVVGARQALAPVGVIGLLVLVGCGVLAFVVLNFRFMKRIYRQYWRGSAERR